MPICAGNSSADGVSRWERSAMHAKLCRFATNVRQQEKALGSEGQALAVAFSLSLGVVRHSSAQPSEGPNSGYTCSWCTLRVLSDLPPMLDPHDRDLALTWALCDCLQTRVWSSAFKSICSRSAFCGSGTSFVVRGTRTSRLASAVEHVGQGCKEKPFRCWCQASVHAALFRGTCFRQLRTRYKLGDRWGGTCS